MGLHELHLRVERRVGAYDSLSIRLTARRAILDSSVPHWAVDTVRCSQKHIPPVFGISEVQSWPPQDPINVKIALSGYQEAGVDYQVSNQVKNIQ